MFLLKFCMSHNWQILQVLFMRCMSDAVNEERVFGWHYRNMFMCGSGGLWNSVHALASALNWMQENSAKVKMLQGRFLNVAMLPGGFL